MDSRIKGFYQVDGRIKRTNFSLKERLEELPKTVWDEVYSTLTDASDLFGRNRHKFGTLIKDKNSDISGYEAAVFCDAIGCTIFELMDERVSLLPIYMKHKGILEENLAHELGLTKTTK